MEKTFKRKYFFFGYVDIDEISESASKVSIVDNLSLFCFVFELNELVKYVDDLVNECVFLMTESSLYAFKHCDESLYKLENPSNASNAYGKWDWKPFEAKSFTKTILNCSNMKDQWSHWSHFFNTPDESEQNSLLLPSQSVRRLFGCTKFGVFIAENLADHISTLQRIYDSRSATVIDYLIHEIVGKVQKICTGNDHVVLLTANGQVLTCGSGNHAELGHGDLESSVEPRIVDMFIEAELKIVDIAVGAWHSCALTDDGDVYGWGWNSEGQLGYETEECSMQLIPYPFDTAKNVVAIQCRQNSTFFTFEDGSKLSFGKCNQL